MHDLDETPLPATDDAEAERSTAEYEADIGTGLKHFFNRTNYEPATYDTPLDAIIAGEPAELDRMPSGKLAAELSRYGFEPVWIEGINADRQLKDRAQCIEILRAIKDAERGAQRETVVRMYQFFTGDGIHPASVLKRLFALGAHAVISPFCDLNLRERGLMLGDSHGAQHWRTQRICVDPLRRRGDRAWKGPGHKSLESRKTYSRVAQGNDNRTKNKKKTA